MITMNDETFFSDERRLVFLLYFLFIISQPLIDVIIRFSSLLNISCFFFLNEKKMFAAQNFAEPDSCLSTY